MANTNKTNFFTSIIVSTYNRPDALELVLLALAEQDCGNENDLFEVVVADDGSTDATRALLDELQAKAKLPYKLRYVWHEDKGFRLALIRNKAVAKSCGDYLVFLDGDCVPLKSFVRKHQRLAEKGWFVAGNRVLLNKDFTDKVLRQKILFHNWCGVDWFLARIKGYCNRFLTLLPLPLSGFMRKLSAKKWQKARGCNLAMWRKDFLAVNGFDESYVGWGYEDSDLVIRLMRNNIFRKSGKFAVPVIHLWHEEIKRSDEEKANYAKLVAVQK